MASAAPVPSANGSSPHAEEKPLFRFGIATDVQYADIDDGFSHGGVPRFYRGALRGLRRAVAAWRAQQVEFAIHLGDIIDGKARTHSAAAITSVLDEFAGLDRKVHHIIGNHCLYNLPRQELNERLDISGIDGASYYAFSPHREWRFIVIDSYDVSVLGWPEGHPNRDAAVEILGEKNPNEEKNSPDGLMGPARRFVMFGGGLSERQLEWLEEQLRAARRDGQRCIVFCHQPVHPDTCTGTTLIWNYDEVMRIVQGAGNVVATLSGHAHANGAATDEFGIHYLVLAAILETPGDEDCYGWVDVYRDRVELVGAGEMHSAVLRFPEAAVDAEFEDLRLDAGSKAEQERETLDRIEVSAP